MRFDLSSDCLGDEEYRVWLSREVALEAPRHDMLIYTMLNPSRARGVGVGDPTQGRCDGFAARIGARRYGLTNLYTRSTPYPEELFRFGTEAAVGPEANDLLRHVYEEAAFYGWPVILACGKPSKVKAEFMPHVRERVRDVWSIAERFGVKLRCLGVTAEGWPRHPLMLGYNALDEYRPWHIGEIE